MPAETAATPKPWRGGGLRAVEAGRRHHGVHGAPAGHARPDPQSHATPLAAPPLQLAEAMHQVERVEQGRWDGYGTIDAGPALLEALDHQHAGGEVHAFGGEPEQAKRRVFGVF